MKIEYYTEFGGAFGSPSYLGSETQILSIADGSTLNNAWLNHVITDTVPSGAVEARLAFIFIQPDFELGAIHIDDVSFTNLDLAFDADANGDADVDGADFLSWQRGFGLGDGTSVAAGDFDYDGLVGGVDLAVWQDQYAGGALAAVHVVPEPSTAGIALISLVGLLGRGRPH